MHDSINKVFNLINKTGDRCVVLSQEKDDAYVVMSFMEYERMALGRADVSELSEDELLDKINRDIAVWKSQQQESRERDLWPDSGQAAPEDGIGSRSKNFADTSRNYGKFADFEDDVREQEEPYYFEKV